MAASHSNQLRFLTWNVNGLETALRLNANRPPDRQKDLFKEMKNADVVFLQETHIKLGQERVMDKFPNWRKHYTVFQRAERGVAIFIKNTIGFECEKEEHDDSGFIVVHCKLEGQPYTFVSVYHHQDDKAILSRLSEYLQNNATGMMVIGGDFNAVFSPFVDKKEPTINQSHSDLLQRVKLFMELLQLVDIWRWLHPFMRFYTYYRRESTSRIDFFFVPGECLWRVQACEIEDVPSNDHLPVSLQLNNTPGPSMLYPTPERTDFLSKYHFPSQGAVGHMRKEIITMAIKSLQVSDTPRPDGIPASVYKRVASDGLHLEYLQDLDSRVLDGSFDGRRNNFSVSYTWRHMTKDFHFFNVDYVILATILAWQLDEKLESQSRSHKKLNYDTHVAMIYYFHEIPESVEWSLLERALISASLLPDFQALQRILKRNPVNDTLQLCQGCPLTPSLHSLLLKYVAAELHNTRGDEIYVYKYFVNVVVPKGSSLGGPDEFNMDGLQVRRNIATSLEHVYNNHKPL